MPTTSDFSGVLVVAAPSATAANNAAGQIIQVQSNMFVSEGPTKVGGTTAQNDLILAVPLFATSRKKLIGVTKTAGATWTAGQSLYINESTGAYATTSTGRTLAGIAADDATSGATTGNVIPCSPF